MAKRGKVVLAYSGGLDTSVAIRWIQDTYNLDVVTLTIDMGAQKDLEDARERALKIGAIKATQRSGSYGCDGAECWSASSSQSRSCSWLC